MPFLRNVPQKSGGESAASSVRSVDSYGIFGSACSDLSDCDCAHQARRYKCKSYISVAKSSSPGAWSCRSAMTHPESTPLLSSAAEAPAYRTITNGSSSDTSDSLDAGPGVMAPTREGRCPAVDGQNLMDEWNDYLLKYLGLADLSATDILETYKKTFEKSSKPEAAKSEKKKQSSIVTIFSVWNTIMGSSLLTMAWGVERAGLAAALTLVAVMAALCLYTAHLLLTVNRYHGSDTCEVPALCRRLLGRTAESVAHAFSLLVLLGANVIYWVLITNFLYYTVNYLMDLQTDGPEYNSTVLCPANEPVVPLDASESEPSPYWGLHTTVPLYVALIVFPLLNFSNVTFFTKFNSLGTLSVLYLLVFVMVKGAAWGINLESLAPEFHVGKDAAVLSGMLALSFYIHNIIITIMTNNARQDKNGRDLTIAFLLVTITYTFVGTVFYICFPLAKSCIEDNLLNNFEMHDVMTAIARALLLFQVVTVFPLVAYMLRSEATLLLPFKDTTCLTVSINLCIVTVCILAACFCPNVGTIIRYTGAISGLVYVFALPAILQARSLQLRGKLTPWKSFFYICIVLFGILNFLMQFFIE